MKYIAHEADIDTKQCNYGGNYFPFLVVSANESVYEALSAPVISLIDILGSIVVNITFFALQL